MIRVKINGKEYEATINGKMNDKDWDNRESKSITLEMSHSEAIETFVEGTSWSILQEQTTVNEEGESVTEILEFDNSEFSMAGDIVDHRDGTVTVKMGKLTDLESALVLLLA